MGYIYILTSPKGKSYIGQMVLQHGHIYVINN
jgi:hypothetical protein